MGPDSAKFNAVLTEMVVPTAGDLSPEHARYVLDLDFTPAQHALVTKLSAKAQEGTLTRDEQYALDVVTFADAMLSVMQAKARASLQRQPQPAA